MTSFAYEHFRDALAFYAEAGVDVAIAMSLWTVSRKARRKRPAAASGVLHRRRLPRSP